MLKNVDFLEKIAYQKMPNACHTDICLFGTPNCAFFVIFSCKTMAVFIPNIERFLTCFDSYSCKNKGHSDAKIQGESPFFLQGNIRKKWVEMNLPTVNIMVFVKYKFAFCGST